MKIGRPETALSVFYGDTHPVYGTWDFTTVWEEHPDALPTLRPPP